MEKEKVELTEEQKAAELAKKEAEAKRREEMKKKAEELGGAAVEKYSQGVESVSKKLIGLLEKNPSLGSSVLLAVLIFIVLIAIKFGTQLVGIAIVALLLSFAPTIIAKYKALKNKDKNKDKKEE